MMNQSTQRFRELLSNHTPLVAPGAFDGLTARMIELAGFDAVYASGGAIARSAGYPDLGLLSFTEVADRLAKIVEATTLPVIADADTGFGGGANVRRTVQEFERLGVVALHIEDQLFPKRCGHLDDKTLIPADEMCRKIGVAKESLRHSEVAIIGRTDAIAVEGFDRAIERANAYAAAGADMIFVEAPETVEQIELIAKQVPTPKLINMFYGGKTPLVPLTRLAELNFRIVIIPSDLQRAAIRSMQKVLQTIRAHGDSSAMSEELASFKEREIIVKTAEFLKY
jgi:2-methylisocitrate lyase-like PEP mutase family enzyme